MNGLHNKNTELHNNSDKNSEKVTSIQDQKADEIDELRQIIIDLAKEQYDSGYIDNDGHGHDGPDYDGIERAVRQLLSLIAHEKIESYKKGYIEGALSLDQEEKDELKEIENFVDIYDEVTNPIQDQNNNRPYSKIYAENGITDYIQDQKADEIDAILSDLEDYHRGYAKGIMPHEAKQQLLALKGRWEREAVLNELIEIQIMSMCLHKDSYERIWNVQKYTSDRIAQLGGKEE